jgi:glycosyltransferase involved in cell wall biosynthesis
VKVLLVSTLDRGGPVEQTAVLAEGLAALGVRVAVACASIALRERLDRARIATLHVPVTSALDLRGAGRLWRLIGGADVVHGQDRRAGLWSRLAPGRRRVARIYTVHGLPDPYLPPPVGDEHPSLRHRLAYELVDAALARRADALILPSQALATEFAQRLHFPSSRMVVVPNGVAPLALPAQRGTAIGTLSLLEPVKDLPTFLRAAAALHRRRPELRFTVAGDGSQREPLQRLAGELGVADVVGFPGFVPAAEALAGLSVLVMTSVFENAPMAVLEAMAVGIPVVASRTGGIPELVGEDGAQIVAPGDVDGFAAAIERLLDDPALAEAQTAAAAQRFAARYTVDENARATLAVYERALAERRG